MSTYAPPSDAFGPAGGLIEGLRRLAGKSRLRRGTLFGTILVGALLAFEIFNYGTTEFALRDLLGDLTFGTLRWSVVLALAFCGMDFAGIARLLTPERQRREAVETWYLLGAWALAATMNAALTWWAVSLALLSHAGLGNEVIGRQTLLAVVPVFVAMLVWLIRVLIIGTFTIEGERLFSQGEKRTPLLLRPRPAHSAASGRPASARPAEAHRPTASDLAPSPAARSQLRR